MDIGRALFARRWLILAAAVLGCLLGGVVCWWIEPSYRATVLAKVVEPTNGGSALAELAGRFGGLAAAAGVQLPGGAKQSEIIAILESRALAEEFIRKHDLLPRLWPDEWDARAKVWRNDAGPPTMQRAVRRFSRRVLDVREDRSTGLIRVSVHWNEPDVAAEWANDIVSMTNGRIRTRVVAESEQAFRVLEAELVRTNNVTLEQVIGGVMQDQLNRIALAKVRDEYALQVIDPAVAADVDDYVWPRPALTTAVGGALGLLVGALIALALAARTGLGRKDP
jgi:uncharacterized protein involved in exopolysaccharide biosynthesis